MVAAALQQLRLIGCAIQVVMDSIPGGVTTEGLTLPGFLQLQTLTIMRERLDICWNMLRQFGYTNHVEIDDALVASAPVQMSTVRALPLMPKWAPACACVLAEALKVSMKQAVQVLAESTSTVYT